MPRKGQNKYQRYSADNLKSAVDAVRSKTLSVRAAFKAYGVPRATISDRVTQRVADGAKNGRPPLIPAQVESGMVNKMLYAADKGFGLSRAKVMKKAGQVCQSLSFSNSFSKKNPESTKVDKDWFEGFKKRHPELVMRKPEPLSTSRSRLMNTHVTNRYFEDLSKTLTDLGLAHKPKCIWNMDETSVSFEHTPMKVVARKGVRALPGRVADSKQTQTVLACVNAAGKAMPPMVVAKGKTQKSLFSYKTHDAPPGTVWMYQSKGYMEDLLGSMWFKEVFVKNCGPERPQLLLLDSHGSHEVLELLLAAKDENIHIMALPPHCTHYLQPLDRTVFGSFSSNYNRICSDFMGSDSNNTVTKSSWASLFKAAWIAALTPDNIMNGFRACGIFPLNLDVIPKSAFAPSEAFIDERPVVSSSESELPLENNVAPTESEETENLEVSSNDDPLQLETPNVIPGPMPDEEPHIAISFTEDMTPSTASDIDENMEAAQVLVNLSFSGSELVEVSPNVLSESLVESTIPPSEYTNKLFGQSSSRENEGFVSWNSDLDAIFDIPMLNVTPPSETKHFKKKEIEFP